MNVTVGVLRKSSNSLDTASCICNEKKLDCSVDHSQYADDLYYLLFDKKYGSVTWTDPTQEKIKIPLDIEVIYISSYELSYREGSWKFKLEAKLQNKIPADSLILVDILGGSGGLAR